MSYRALFLADVHVGNNLPWSVKNPETLITDRCLDILQSLDQVSQYAQENQVKDIWILGDLVDKRLIDAVTLKLVVDTLCRMKHRGLQVRLVPGNHEAGDASGKHFTLDAFAYMGFWVAGMLDAPHRDGKSTQISLIEPVDGFEVMAMPYLPAARAIEMLENGPQHTPHLMLIHQTIKGGTVGGWVSPEGLEPSLLEGIAATVLSGHFHDAQFVTRNTIYLGAPVQHTFADQGQGRGFWDMKWEGNVLASKRQIPIVGSPKFYELSTAPEELLDNSHPTNIYPVNSYVNIKVTGSKIAVDKSWEHVLKWCDDFKAMGMRLVRPIAVTSAEPARERIKLGDGDERPTWDKVISSYLDAVDCTGLDRQRLEALGKELMADADR